MWTAWLQRVFRRKPKWTDDDLRSAAEKLRGPVKPGEAVWLTAAEWNAVRLTKWSRTGRLEDLK